MSLKIREVAMPRSQYAVKCPYEMTPTRIVIHNTAGKASAANEIAYMQSNANQVSFHFAVDEEEAVLGSPLNRNCWHSARLPMHLGRLLKSRPRLLVNSSRRCKPTTT